MKIIMKKYYYLKEKNPHFSTRLKTFEIFITTTTAIPISTTTRNYETLLEIQNGNLPFVVNSDILGKILIVFFFFAIKTSYGRIVTKLTK